MGWRVVRGVHLIMGGATSPPYLHPPPPPPAPRLTVWPSMIYPVLMLRRPLSESVARGVPGLTSRAVA